MGQTIRKQLDGNIPEFLADVKREGRWRAMERWELKSYLPVAKLILEETGDEYYGLSPTNRTYNDQGIRGVLREFVVAFANYAIRKELENEKLRRQLEPHKANSRELEYQFADELTGILEGMRNAPDE